MTTKPKPIDPILAAAIEAERQRKQQSTTAKTNATNARNQIENANKAQVERAKSLGQYTTSHDDIQHVPQILSNIVKGLTVSPNAHSFYVNASNWESKVEQAANAYANHQTGANLKKFNDAKKQFVTYAKQYAKTAGDTRSAEEIWGANSIGSAVLGQAKSTTTTAPSVTSVDRGLGAEGSAVNTVKSRGQKTVKTTRTGDTVEVFANGTNIIKTKSGAKITTNPDGSIDSAVDNFGKTLSKSKVISIFKNVGITPPPSGDKGGGNTYITYGGGGGGNTLPTAPKKKSSADLMADYGMQAAVINSDPSLKALFARAVKEQMPVASFQAALVNTSFYQSHSDNWRIARVIELSKKTEWNTQLDSAANFIKQEATSLGMSLTPSDVTALAKNALYFSAGDANGITQNWLDTHIAEYGKVTGKGGTTLDTINNLKQLGASMGIQHDDSWYTSAAKSIVAKTADQTTYEQQIKDLAKSKYAGFADQIDAGQTVSQIASPYINSMSNILELPSSTINLNDATINQALTNVDASTNKPAVQPLWQFEQNLKQDNRYFKTNQAKQSFLDLANNIATTFGKA